MGGLAGLSVKSVFKLAAVFWVYTIIVHTYGTCHKKVPISYRIRNQVLSYYDRKFLVSSW